MIADYQLSLSLSYFFTVGRFHMIANEWRYVDLQSWQTQYLAIIFSHGLARPLSKHI
jgi:hypothetical protein